MNRTPVPAARSASAWDWAVQPHVRPHAGRHAAGPRPARSMPYRPLGEVRAPILRGQAHRPSSCRPWRMEPLYRQDRQWPFAANPPFPAARRHARAMPAYGRNRADPDIYGELNHCRQTPCRASSANDGPHPCHARTRRAIHHHCPQSRSTAAIAPCVPLLQPGTNRLSHNSGSSSLGVGAIPTAILGFEGLICADVMKREELSQSRVMTQPPFRWICHAVMMTAEPEHGKSRMLHRPAGHGQP